MGKSANPVEQQRKNDKLKAKKKQKEQRLAAQEAKEKKDEEPQEVKPRVKVTMDLQVADGKKKRIVVGASEHIPAQEKVQDLDDVNLQDLKDVEFDDLIENLPEEAPVEESEEDGVVEVDLDALMEAEDVIIVEYQDLSHIKIPAGEPRKSRYYHALHVNEIRHKEPVKPAAPLIHSTDKSKDNQPKNDKPKEQSKPQRNKPRPPMAPPINLALPKRPVMPSALKAEAIPEEAVISAAPVLRDLQKELTGLVPAAIKRKRPAEKPPAQKIIGPIIPDSEDEPEYAPPKKTAKDLEEEKLQQFQSEMKQLMDGLE
jgi:hypothetical protein